MFIVSNTNNTNNNNKKVVHTRGFSSIAPEDGIEVKSWKTDEKEPELKTGDYITKFGTYFQWSDEHLNRNQLNSYRKRGDLLCDNVLSQLKPDPHEDVFSKVVLLAKEHQLEDNSTIRPTSNDVYKQFMKQVTTVPDWVDWERIERGQKVFVRYAPGAGSSLMHLSLVGGFGAQLINKVLTSTGYLASKHTSRRLWETTQMIVDCLYPSGMLPLVGRGWKSCMNVRFLHGKVRQRLRAKSAWDEERYGVPINQEDLCATLISFQLNVIYALDLMGYSVSQEEVEDYTHLWRYIGYLNGIEDDVNPCTHFTRSKAFADSVVMHLVEPDDTSIYLSNHVLLSVSNKPPYYMPYEAHAQLARMLMGDDLADRLQIPFSLYYYYVHTIQWKIMNVYGEISKLPIVGDFILKFNLSLLQLFLDKGLEGSPAQFTLQHSPREDSLGNINVFKSESEKGYILDNSRKEFFKKLLAICTLLALILYIRHIRKNH